MVEVGQQALTYRSEADPGYRACLQGWETFTFQMGVAVAHEIVHLLTGFLVATGEYNTPPSVSYEGYGNDRQGEAGWHWEANLFGGEITFYEDRADPLRAR